MNFASLGTTISGMAAIAFLIVTLITFRARRMGREARETRELRETNVAAFRWKYKVDMLAARRGWDTDPDWPPTPREMTAEYLVGRAEGTGSSELATLAQTAAQLAQGMTAPTEHPGPAHHG